MSRNGYHAARKARLKAGGLCQDCGGGAPAAGKTLCAGCLESRRTRERARRGLRDDRENPWRCGVCGRQAAGRELPPDAGPDGRHRGHLCGDCRRGIRFLKADPAMLLRAKRYLEGAPS